jgi:hypothetical protein
MSAPMMSEKLSPECMGILQKLAAAIQQGEQVAQQARREADALLVMCAEKMGIDFPATYEFQGDRFVPRRGASPPRMDRETAASAVSNNHEN